MKVTDKGGVTLPPRRAFPRDRVYGRAVRRILDYFLRELRRRTGMHASDVVSHNAGGIGADAARIVVCRWADCADDVFLVKMSLRRCCV